VGQSVCCGRAIMTKLRKLLGHSDSIITMQRTSTDHVDKINYRMRIMGMANDWSFNFTRRDKIGFYLENWVTANPRAFFYILLVTSLFLVAVLGLLWCLFADTDSEKGMATTFWTSAFFTFQIMTIGGHEKHIEGVGSILVYIFMIVLGITIFAILIGMITESFQVYMSRLSEGRTNAVLSDHTLILGWNETTARCVVQIARLRNLFREQNKPLKKKFLWWTRCPPSTPVAVAPIVIFADTVSKAAVHAAISEAFKDSGICPDSNRLGADIICRIGNPTHPQDLRRVGAKRARSILVMMTDVDAEESELASGKVNQGATLRTVLALRAVFMGDEQATKGGEDKRVIVQLAGPSRAIEVIDLGDGVDDNPILQPVELTNFMNSILFGCLAQPGLGYAMLDLLGFEGAAFRCRAAKEFPAEHKLIGKTVQEVSTMWENAIFAGVDSLGLAPPGDYVIREHDRVIFVSDMSLPTLAEMPPVPRDSLELNVAKPAALAARTVLICGWRDTWNLPTEFAVQRSLSFRTCRSGRR